MTIEINNEASDDLLPSKVNAQFIPAQFLPQHLFCGRHPAAQFTGAFEFFRVYLLAGDDVLDGHVLIIDLTLTLPQGGGNALPFPIRKGLGGKYY